MKSNQVGVEVNPSVMKKNQEKLVNYLLENSSVTGTNIKEIREFFNNSISVLEEYNKEGGYLTYIMVLPNGKLYVGQTKNPAQRHHIQNYMYGRIGEELRSLGLKSLSTCFIIYTNIYKTRQEALNREEELIGKFSATTVANCNVCARSITHAFAGKKATLLHVSIAPNKYAFVGTVRVQNDPRLKRVRFSSCRQAARILNVEYAEVKNRVDNAKAEWMSATELDSIIKNMQ